MTTDEEPSAGELERRGEYETAAAAYARRGFNELINAHFELDFVASQGIGLLLQAISCDRRAGNHRRPAHLTDICRPLLEKIRKTSEDTTQAGLAAEWLGDLVLMLGEGDIEDIYAFYDEAAEQFEGMERWGDEIGWTGEPDFRSAYWAIQGFSEYHDGPLPQNPEDVSFHKRLDRKRKLADQILS